MIKCSQREFRNNITAVMKDTLFCSFMKVYLLESGSALKNTWKNTVKNRDFSIIHVR